MKLKGLSDRAVSRVAGTVSAQVREEWQSLSTDGATEFGGSEEWYYFVEYDSALDGLVVYRTDRDGGDDQNFYIEVSWDGEKLLDDGELDSQLLDDLSAQVGEEIAKMENAG